MNKNLYRIVFNKARGLLMVVAENTAAQRKGDAPAGSGSSGRYFSTHFIKLKSLAFAAKVMLGALVVVTPIANAQIAVDRSAQTSQQATILKTANGTTQVDIRTPSAAGVSRNTFSQFDVNQSGVVLNNSRTSTQTQIGGWVQANPWLAAGGARVILNEVNSSNPSQLRGYVEVAGGKAQVIIANPAGVTCDGCGFINADRTTLTTGVPIINGGSLDGYIVRQGTVTVTANGMDTSQSSYTDLIARAVKINAGIWAKDLKITTGANQVDAQASHTSAISGIGPAPSIAIDVSQLGGMYANKIQLIGTEAGLGVRNAGQIGASAGDVVVTAQGTLENIGHIGAGGHTTIKVTGNVANSGSIYTGRDLSIDTAGDIGNTNTIIAGGDVSLRASGSDSQVTNGANSVIGAGIASDGSVGASGNLLITASKNVESRGQIVSGGDQFISGGTLDFSSSQVVGRNLGMFATLGDIDLSHANVQASQNFQAETSRVLRNDGGTVSAGQLNLSANSISNREGDVTQFGVGDTDISLAGDFDNTQGRIAGNSGTLSIRAANLLNEKGAIQHAGDGALVLTGSNIDSANGTLTSNAKLVLTADDVQFDSAHVVAGNLDIQATSISNRAGEIVQTGAAPGSIRVAGSLDNTAGTIASSGDLSIVSADLENANGKIAADKDLALQANRLGNQHGRISAGEQLTASVTSSADNTEGLIASNKQLKLSAGDIENSYGTIGAVHEGVEINARTGEINNSAGRIEAMEGVQLSSSGLTNADGNIVGGHVSIDTRSQLLDNTHGTIAGSSANTGTIDIASGDLKNDRGSIQAQGALSIDTDDNTLSNTNSGDSGGITSQSTINLQVGALENDSGFIGAKGVAQLASNLVNNRQGGVIAGQDAITLSTQSLDNSEGKIQASGSLEIGAGTGTVKNVRGLISSDQTTTIAAQAVNNGETNTAGLGIQGRSIDIRSDDLGNVSGAILADNEINVRGKSSIDNYHGLISSMKDISLLDEDANTASQKTLSITNTDGTIIGGQSVAVDVHTLTNAGNILSGGDLSARSDSIANAGKLQANNNLEILVIGQLANDGNISAGQSASLEAASIDNRAAGEISAEQLALTATDSHTLTNRGLIDGHETVINTVTLNNVGTGRIYGDHVAINATTLLNDAETVSGLTKAGTIASRGRLDIGASNITNREHATLFSAGDMAIGGSLDASNNAVGQADLLSNNSATIESLGGLDISSKSIKNTNEHFSTAVVQVSKGSITKYQGSGASTWYDPNQIYTYEDESWHLHTPQGNYESWSRYNFTRVEKETQVTQSDPGTISAANGINIKADSVLNDKSKIIAGGDIAGDIGTLTNTSVSGQHITTDSGTVTSYWRHREKGRDSTSSDTSSYAPASSIQTISLTPTVYLANTATVSSGTTISNLTLASVEQGAQGSARSSLTIGSGRAINSVVQVPLASGNSASGPALVVRTGFVNTAVPASSLFRTSPNPTASYLIETDPQFASYRSWLSSDYILQQLSLDPTTTQKRLGDGFYEQKLVREQIAQLTGKRFLDGYSNDETEYRALIDNAVTVASQMNLRPGVALTAAQMAALTSDIVWLVEQQVTLPNGQVTKALVPQVYVRVKDGDLSPSGALIAGGDVNLNVAEDLVNSGAIAGRNVVALNAQNIQNLGGRISGNDTVVQARDDINNIGGLIEGADSLSAIAGRDLNVASTTSTQSTSQGTRTNIDRVAALYVSNPSATLIASAGRNANLNGAQIINAGAGGATKIVASENLNLGTVKESRTQTIVWDSKNSRRDGDSQEIGTTVNGQGDIQLMAGNDLNARAANMTSASGALTAIAGNDVNFTTGTSTQYVDEAHRHKSKSGWFSSKTVTTRDTLNAATSQATVVSGQTVSVQADHDINIKGSNVVSTSGTVLAANNNVNIAAATDTKNENHFRKVKKSGLFGSGGFGFTIGSQEQSAQGNNTGKMAAASTAGSTQGNVSIYAGTNYRQVGSHVAAPQGDVAIFASKVDIVEAQNTNVAVQETKFKQSGLTVAVTSPVITAIQTAQQMSEAAKDTKDARMQVLAGATTALSINNAAEAIQRGQGTTINGKENQIFTGNDANGNSTSRDANAADKAGGINISISVGGSKSESKTTQTSSTTAGSTVVAGSDVNIVATGAGSNSDIAIQGSDINAGRNIVLSAEDEVRLLAAKNTADQHSNNKNSSGSVGISFGTGGLLFTAGASAGRGKADGSDVSWSNTHVTAGNQVAMQSGGDTTLKGAVVNGKQVVADVGGNLQITSLQDTSKYDSKQQSMGGSISVGYGKLGGSFSASKSKIESDYASVTETSGVKAGDEGFQVNVEGNTNLAGAVIASTDAAVQDGKNSFQTASLTTSDIQNNANYKASSASVNFGSGISFDGALGPAGTGGGIGNDSGDASSVTESGISGIASNKNVRTGDKESGIQKIFDADRVQREINAQVQITQTFSQQASKAVGDYVGSRRKSLQEQLKNAPDSDKAAIQKELSDLRTEEQAMNILIGVVSGMGTSAVTKEALSTAADQMRQFTIKDSQKFSGVTDGKTVLSNVSGESEGIRGDGIKTGGTRVDIDFLCGPDNSRCVKQKDANGDDIIVNGKPQLALNNGLVQFDPEAAGMGLEKFLQSDEGKKMAGATGGVQGAKGTLFGVPYEAGSFFDKLVESYGGSHDVIGGTLTGLYDNQGNIKQGMSDAERAAHDYGAIAAVLPATPFAMSELSSPQLWQAISILTKAAAK